jgi:hypothetical protein
VLRLHNMVYETILALTLETTISANVIFEFAKTFEIQLRHSDVRIRARLLPTNSITSFMRPKHLWRATSYVEVTLSERSVALAVLRSQAAPTTHPPTYYLLDHFAQPCRINLPPPSRPRDLAVAHSKWLSSPHLCGLIPEQSRSRLTSLLCEMWC